MNKIVTAFVKGLALLCACVAITAHAGEELTAINTAVEQRAAEIDQKFGVLLTNQERNNLKIALIVSKVSKEQKEGAGNGGGDDPATQKALTTKAVTDKAIKTYEITDPVDQRQLLIEMDAYEDDGGGLQPPKT
jgi:hypothetical protein